MHIHNHSLDSCVLKWGGAILGAFMAAAFAANIAHAQVREGRPHTPPAEAFAPCKDKQAADACEVVMGEHTITGTCAASPDAGLFCRP